MKISGARLGIAALLILAVPGIPSCKKSNGPDPLALTRGPFLAETTTTSLVIAWSTNNPGDGAVEYSAPGGSPSTAAGSASATDHAVTILGLDPGTTYSYRVLTSGTVLADGRTFATAREPSDPRLRFCAFGDGGSGWQAQYDVAARVLAADPDLVIITGDIIYPKGAAGDFNPKYFVPYADLIDHIPFYPSLGNHDVATADGQPYLDAFHLPHNNPAGTEEYYSFESANALFIALDSTQSLAEGSPQRAWLIPELSRVSDWKFVYFHHPPFSSALHTSDLTIRAQVEPLFDAAGVDIVFNGHDHDYERSYPIHQGSPVNQGQDPHYTSPGGVVYVVTGGGGYSLYQKTEDNPFTAYFESTHHMVQVDIDGSSLTLQAIRSDGTVMDTLTIAK